MSDHDTVPFAAGHIEVYDTSHVRIQRDGDEITETPFRDRAHVRIYARGDDGFLAGEMTPSDAYALFDAVRRRCPDAEPRTLDLPVGLPLTDDEAAELEQRLRDELAKPADYKAIAPTREAQTVSLRTITTPHGTFIVIDDEYKDKLVDYYGQKLAVVPASVVDDTAKQALTLKPGETLIIRVSDLTPRQMQQYQEHLEAMLEYRGLDLRALVVYGDELAVQQREVSEAGH